MVTLSMTQTSMTKESSEIIHWVWDDSPDESLCGKDMSNERFSNEGEQVNCEDCIYIDTLCKLSELKEATND